MIDHLSTPQKEVAELRIERNRGRSKDSFKINHLFSDTDAKDHRRYFITSILKPLPGPQRITSVDCFRSINAHCFLFALQPNSE